MIGNISKKIRYCWLASNTKNKFLTLWYKAESQNNRTMKRILFSIILMAGIIALGSCDYDDSNDIDILKPVDSTATGITIPDLPN